MSKQKPAQNTSENVEIDYKMLNSAFSKIRNRNEHRVKKILFEMLKEFESHQLDLLDLQDIYALSLNLLPSRYTQEFSVVLNESVTDDQIKKSIRTAAVKVFKNPKRKV